MCGLYVQLLGCFSQHHRRDGAEEAPGVLRKPGSWLWDWVGDFSGDRVFGEYEVWVLSPEIQTATRTDAPREGTCAMSGLEAAACWQ